MMSEHDKRPGGGQNGGDGGTQTGVVVKTLPRTRKPAMYTGHVNTFLASFCSWASRIL